MALENADSQNVAPARKQNWSDKDKQDDLKYILYCLDLGQKNDDKKLRQKLKYDMQGAAEAEKPKLKRECEENVEKVKQRSKLLQEMVFELRARFKTFEGVRQQLCVVEPSAGSSTDKPVTQGQLVAALKP